ncbi:MAG: CBS domain-containing protein [Burkholderiales bacterium]|nr:CBS domain-containing protein [Burkholderiales bacterium]
MTVLPGPGAVKNPAAPPDAARSLASGILAASTIAGVAPLSEPPSSRPARAGSAAHADRRSLFTRLVEAISPGPDSKDELIRTLADAEQRELIEPESRLMLEGVLRMADLTAGDVMVPATRMDLLDIAADYDELLGAVIATAHSRFPVYDGTRENVIGILMAKDLLKLQRAPELNLRTLLRPAVFVPESKRLNELLRDFRSNRNHLAIVIDEFGNTAGLITIEDVLEEIVGEIEDEFDEQAQENGIYTLADGSHRVAGDVAIGAVNEAFGTALPEQDFDTIGGLVAQELGRVPRRGEAVELGGLRFTVMITRGGAVRWFRVARVPTAASTEGGDVD